MDASSQSGPVTDKEFGGALQALAPELPLAVAVSGGADSMALLRLTCNWAKAQGALDGIIAFTFDHGLREASHAEACQVAQWCAQLGIKHRTLSWQGKKPSHNIQAEARRARYSALSAACLQHGLSCLLLGHQLEDQAETFLLRLGRGSGVDGLSAMASQVEWRGIRLLRPLLGFSRYRLRARLTALHQPWLEDPSNTDHRFARVRARALLGQMEEAGISVARLAGTAKHMARARAALEESRGELMRSTVNWDHAGSASLFPQELCSAPEEISLRVLSLVLMSVGGREYPPRLRGLLRLYHWLQHNPVSGGKTLAGCIVLPRRGRILVAREYASIGPDIELLAGAETLWDNRFRVRLRGTGAGPGHPLMVRAVGDAGLQQIRKMGVSCFLFPHVVCKALPGLWHGKSLLAAPHLGFPESTELLQAAPLEARFEPPSSVAVQKPASF